MEEHPTAKSKSHSGPKEPSGWTHIMASLVFSISNFVVLGLYGKVHFEVMLDHGLPRGGELGEVSLDLLRVLGMLRYLFGFLACVWALLALRRRPRWAAEAMLVLAIVSLMTSFLIM